jgi:hypothetical protein
MMQLALDLPTRVRVLRNDGLGVTLASSMELPRQETIRVTDSEGNEARVNIYNGRRTLNGEWLGFGTIYEGWLEEHTSLPQSTALRGTPRSKIHVPTRAEVIRGLEGQTIDLSRDGLQIEVHQPLEVGENLEVILDLDDGGEPLEAWTSVRWCRKGPVCRVGLQFIGATVSQRARIEDYILWHDLEGSSREPDGGRSEVTVFSSVFLKDVFQFDRSLAVRLVLDSSVIEQRFAEPLVMKFGKREAFLRRVVRKALTNSRFFYRYFDQDDLIVLGFEAGLPDVTICEFPDSE